MSYDRLVIANKVIKYLQEEEMMPVNIVIAKLESEENRGSSIDAILGRSTRNQNKNVIVSLVKMKVIKPIVDEEALEVNLSILSSRKAKSIIKKVEQLNEIKSHI